MDVTPIAKPGATISTPKSGDNPDRRDVVKSPNGDFAVSPEQDAAIADPVKRAEEAIGGFFADSRYPTGRFSIDHDEDSGRYVYRLVDRETDEVLKQFPGDYVLRRVAYYRELQGLAVNSEV